MVYWIGKIDWTCAIQDSQICNTLCERSAPYPPGQVFHFLTQNCLTFLSHCLICSCIPQYKMQLSSLFYSEEHFMLLRNGKILQARPYNNDLLFVLIRCSMHPIHSLCTVSNILQWFFFFRTFGRFDKFSQSSIIYQINNILE